MQQMFLEKLVLGLIYQNSYCRLKVNWLIMSILTLSRFGFGGVREMERSLWLRILAGLI